MHNILFNNCPFFIALLYVTMLVQHPQGVFFIMNAKVTKLMK